MGDLTLNISRHELKCRCGECNVRIQDHEPIIQIVQDVCDSFARKYGVPKVSLYITSAARCYEYNRIPIDENGPGSNDESQHPRCRAMDIQLFINGAQVPPALIYKYLCAKYPHKYGFGLYNSFVHADDRPIKARW